MEMNIVSCGFGTMSAVLPATDQSGWVGKEGRISYQTCPSLTTLPLNTPFFHMLAYFLLF